MTRQQQERIPCVFLWISLSCVLLGWCQTAEARAQWKRVTLPGPNSGNQQTACVVADMDKDGINDFVTAITVLTEIFEWGRFESPQALMAYLGLVPSEHSSGERRRPGAITKTGNQRVRRLLERGKVPNQAVVAVARELAGFIWAALREYQLRRMHQVA
jgi:hypothetical protein